MVGLAETDTNFQLQLWDQLLSLSRQAQYVMNINNFKQTVSISNIIGPFDFNQTLLMPPETKAIVFNQPTVRGSWKLHGTDGCYVGLAKQHYHQYTFFIPETNNFQIEQMVRFFPAYC